MTVEMRALSGSEARHPETAQRTRDADPAEELEISVYLNPHSPEFHASAALQGRRETREQMRSRRVAEHEDEIRAVTAFAAEHGLQVVETDPGRRLVRLSGTVAQFGQAFQADLGIYDAGQGEFRSYNGNLSVPASLAPSIESILGLDNRPAARPHFVPNASAAVETGHLPNAVGALYGFPGGVNGAGRCIAIIELGGGYQASDTAAAFAAMSLPVPTVVAVSVDGGTNSPGSSADGEVALDIQVAGGVAPGARLAVYFAPNTTQGFVDAVSTAIHDATNEPSVISISWGAAEALWGASEMTPMNTALQDAASLGVSVFVASGDNFATDDVSDGKVHVDFPAASPWAIGCGGTTIDTSGSTINSEVVWNSGGNGTGGGISDFAAVPAFQASTTLPPSVNDGGHRRGVPDVAGDADPSSGYVVVLNGQSGLFGGTSAVAPLWAGLTARLNQMLPTAESVGFFLPRLYQYSPAATRDVTVGNNKPPGQPNLGYNAGPGWDACTGWGAPNGNMLAMILARTATALGSVAAVEWVDSILHIRVYCQLQNNQIQEFCWDNGWTVGASLPTAGPSSRLAAVHWSDGAGVHLRVYWQDAQNTIHEECYDGKWTAGAGTWAGAAPGSALAAVQWSDGGGVHLRVYWQDAQNTIHEQCYDSGRWAAGAGTWAGAAPGSGLAAVQWSDGGGVHLRVYYQNAQNVIHEQCYDGSWRPGATLLTAAPASKLAAVHWTDSNQHLRVYTNSGASAVRESCYDGQGWSAGQFLVPTA